MKDFLHSFWDYRRIPRRFIWWGGFAFLWYLAPRAIKHYNMRDCKNMFPDYKNPEGGWGNKVRPFFGYVLNVGENEAVSWTWWDKLEKLPTPLER